MGATAIVQFPPPATGEYAGIVGWYYTFEPYPLQMNSGSHDVGISSVERVLMWVLTVPFGGEFMPYFIFGSANLNITDPMRLALLGQDAAAGNKPGPTIWEGTVLAPAAGFERVATGAPVRVVPGTILWALVAADGTANLAVNRHSFSGTYGSDQGGHNERTLAIGSPSPNITDTQTRRLSRTVAGRLAGDSLAAIAPRVDADFAAWSTSTSPRPRMIFQLLAL